MPEYLRLKKGVRPIRDDGFNVLFDNKTASEFHLDEDQLDLIYQLDGSRTLDEIMAGFNEESRENVDAFLSKLSEIGYLERKNCYSKKQFPKQHFSPYLEGVFFDITSQCNLLCNHCYVSEYHRESKGRDLSFSEILTILDDLSFMNVRDLTITGGEPTQRADISQILQEIANRDLRISAFFTNGFGVKKEIAKLLASLPHFIRVYISLDGIDPNMHAKIRGSKINPSTLFHSVLSSIRMFIDHGIPVTINTCLHRSNVKVLPQFYDLLKTLRVSQWRIAMPKPIGRYVQSQFELMPEWTDVLNGYKMLLEAHLPEVILSDEGFFAPLEIEFELLFRTEMVVKPVRLYHLDEPTCLYHKNRCSIKANGNVVSCGYLDNLVIGNTREKPFNEIWLSDEMQRVKNMRIREITECSECPVIGLCGTGCRANAFRIYGDMRRKDNYACAQVIKFHREILPALFEQFRFSMRTTEEDVYSTYE